MAETTGRTYPAPGSLVPGAPPPLKRALTPADGVHVSASAANDSVVALAAPVGAPVIGSTRSRFTAAAALMGVAVGLELAGVLATRGGRHKGRHS